MGSHGRRRDGSYATTSRSNQLGAADLVNDTAISANTTLPAAMTTLSVPGWATWTWRTEQADPRRPARHVCLDELCSWIAAKVPGLSCLGAVNGTMPCTLLFTESSTAPWLSRDTR